ncbi:MAG: NAD(P)/FAD-dependent oxidoreductase, partial [Rhizobiales bacterium]|nr:NAD(P)/FAD-dependent oxidoreductase [Hyphomicrobiales bacterium]
MTVCPQLAELERKIAADLTWIEAAPKAWIPARGGPEGAPVQDVVVIGAGLSGLSIGFGLKRQGVVNMLLLDSRAEGEEGPWLTCARMDTLRSPKHLAGPDLGVPSLTYRAWHEAIHGAEAWESVGKISREDWMEYLRWYRRVTPERIYTRKVVLATGIEGAGGHSVPAIVSESLPRDAWTHSGERIDLTRLAGRDVGILGSSSSAFDWATAALRAGARSATLFGRATEFSRTEVLAWTNFPGFLGHFADLDDLRRWRFMRRFFDFKTPPTTEMFNAARAFPNFRLELGCPPERLGIEDGRIRLDTPRGRFDFDHLLLGT